MGARRVFSFISRVPEPEWQQSKIMVMFSPLAWANWSIRAAKVLSGMS